ncbi:hypothetical protein P171DRAFT_431640 [Karstenula rhodostoma CBS 690.94]|uniref:Uncharacterized protein n=1 Tax=Karstenula rhodostoma CBS 690.94 TaxID=1392251 RepID=A0A9P4UCY7_9PLEO|nr:hypothetical protein P171DRAFT_431640 [Karstenula rhodostoma CBS 690.94]
MTTYASTNNTTLSVAIAILVLQRGTMQVAVVLRRRLCLSALCTVAIRTRHRLHRRTCCSSANYHDLPRPNLAPLLPCSR